MNVVPLVPIAVEATVYKGENFHILLLGTRKLEIEHGHEILILKALWLTCKSSQPGRMRIIIF